MTKMVMKRSGTVNKLILEQVYNHRSQYFEGKSILDKQEH